jgi:Kef-type K+ transport system membrane component KefB
MWALSFIMINVGYEFTIDKGDLGEYLWDYLIAMTAAGFPWLFVGFWMMVTMSEFLNWNEALLVARFAAPTSAGILFSMLDAAGLKDTWVFQKARILAIFDDLDTILFMIPLKIIMVGFKWELIVVIGIIVLLLWVAWRKLHQYRLPFSWNWTLFYAAFVAAFCKMLHHITHYYIPMEPLHIEVLLPAFVIGCLIDTPCARHELTLQRQNSLARKERRSLTMNLGDILDGLDEPTAAPQEPSSQRIGGEMEKPAPPVVDELEVVVLQGPTDNCEPAVTSNGVCHKVAWDKDTAQPPRNRSKESSGSQPSGNSAERLSRYGVPIVQAQKNPVTSATEKVPEQKNAAVHFDPELKEEEQTVMKSMSSASSHEETHDESAWEHHIQTAVSVVFMLLVGLSMPPLVGQNASDDESGFGPEMIIFHVFVVSVLMFLGKMCPCFCYRDEVGFKERFALCLGMCPRGEVGASIIVISLELKIGGPALVISMISLALNLIMSGGFIAAVKRLLQHSGPSSVMPGGADVGDTEVNDVGGAQAGRGGKSCEACHGSVPGIEPSTDDVHSKQIAKGKSLGTPDGFASGNGSSFEEPPGSLVERHPSELSTSIVTCKACGTNARVKLYEEGRKSICLSCLKRALSGELQDDATTRVLADLSELPPEEAKKLIRASVEKKPTAVAAITRQGSKQSLTRSGSKSSANSSVSSTGRGPKISPADARSLAAASSPAEYKRIQRVLQELEK